LARLSPSAAWRGFFNSIVKPARRQTGKGASFSSKSPLRTARKGVIKRGVIPNGAVLQAEREPALSEAEGDLQQLLTALAVDLAGTNHKSRREQDLKKNP
jgi:hypothetical protein